MTIASMPKRSLPHAHGVKKAVPTVTTFEATNQVIPFLPVESSTTTFWASKPDGCISSRHLPPPTETIVASPQNVSIPMALYGRIKLRGLICVIGANKAKHYSESKNGSILPCSILLLTWQYFHFLLPLLLSQYHTEHIGG